MIFKINNIENNNIIVNDVNNDITSGKKIDKSNNAIKKINDEEYSMILMKYLGYDVKNKKKFSFWNFICSQFNGRSNNMKLINNCAKMINNYLSLEKIIINGINIDLLLTNYESQEFNNIDILNRIIDDDFRKTIKYIREKSIVK